MSKVPVEIVNAINGMLAPYGESYIAGASAPPEGVSAGYKSTFRACQYLGISKSALYRLIKEGAIRPIKLNREAKNGKVVFAVADLEAYISSCRA